MTGRAKQQNKKGKKQNKKTDYFSDSPADADMEEITAWLLLALQAGWWGIAGRLAPSAC